jgi:hypothetical protein
MLVFASDFDASQMPVSGQLQTYFQRKTLRLEDIAVAPLQRDADNSDEDLTLQVNAMSTS